MERVVRGRSFTLSQTFYSDGVATTPTGIPTVAIVRSDGTTVTAGSVAGTGTGPYTVTVTAANNALLDALTVTWTATIGGQSNTYIDIVEVAGDSLFSVAQALAVVPTATAAQIVDARIYAETELENAVGYALLPRYALDHRSGQWNRPLRLRPYVRAIRSVSISGVALSAGDIANLQFDGSYLYNYWWPTGWGNITVSYEHGLDAPPPGATQAALALAVDYLGATPAGTEGNIDPRAESIITVDGTIRLRSAAGQFAATGVNEWVAANRLIPVA